MDLIEHKTRNIQSMFRSHLCGQHLVESGVTVIYNSLAGCHDLGAL